PALSRSTLLPGTAVVHPYGAPRAAGCLDEAAAMTNETGTDNLVQACQQGHTAAFGALVRRYQGAGYAVALSFLHDGDDARDVLQDAFVTAFCRLGQLREPAAF